MKLFLSRPPSPQVALIYAFLTSFSRVLGSIVLVVNLNKQTEIAKSKSEVTKWVPANWKASGAKVDPKNPLSNQTYAQKKALTFIDYRYSLKKFINFMYSQVVDWSKFLTKKQGNQMKIQFWKSDTFGENNITLLANDFMEKCTKLKKNFPVKFQNMTGRFEKQHPGDVANLMWKL